MIYVIDKNTNRVIYSTEEGKPFLLDVYTYRFDGPPMEFRYPSWQYKLKDGKLVHSPKVKPQPPAKAKTAINSAPSEA